MHFAKFEQWILQHLLTGGYISFADFEQQKKLFNYTYTESFEAELQEKLDHFLLERRWKLFKRSASDELYWCKINIHGQAISRLVGMGSLEEAASFAVIPPLLLNDTADQSGDTIICILDDSKDGLLKIQHIQEENRILIKLYGNDWWIQQVGY